MTLKRTFLYIIPLSILIVSCGSRKATKKTSITPKPIVAEAKEPEKKTELKRQGNYDFYTVNIADVAKNDNTISYGSIVSAKPAGYEVKKTYFPSLGQNFRQRFLILHYTALDDDRSISVLTQQSVSAHYLVNDYNDKEIYQLVDENKRAYHAGISHWRGFEQLNDNSIGIEIVNTGYTVVDGKRVFVNYPEWQYKKVAALVKDIVNRYQIPATNVLGHSDVAPTRKQDPGPTFPWKRLYKEYQIGMWYDDFTVDQIMDQIDEEQFDAEASSSPFIFKYQTMLKDFGYGILPTGTVDDATTKTVEAFQYHFRPELYDGVMDIETYAILQALLQKYPK